MKGLNQTHTEHARLSLYFATNVVYLYQYILIIRARHKSIVTLQDCEVRIIITLDTCKCNLIRQQVNTRSKRSPQPTKNLKLIDSTSVHVKIK